MSGDGESIPDWELRKREAREIAEEFAIPQGTARNWRRRIGNIEHLKETIGVNGSEDYLDTISRYEWIPEEMEEIENEWIEPLKRWYVERTDDIYLVHESEIEQFKEKKGRIGSRSLGLGSGWCAIEFPGENPPAEESDDELFSGVNWSEEMLNLQDELELKETIVKWNLRRFDSEWIGKARKLWQLQKELIEFYQTYLDESEQSHKYKKDEIMHLKRDFPYLRTRNKLVAKITDSSLSYVREFKHIPGEGIANRQIKGKVRDDVFERDNQECVSCGTTANLVLHHIEPRDQGGENSKDNLAVLCEQCHYYAHGGGKPTNDGGYYAANFRKVEYSDKEKFWSEWINRDFGDRAPKGFTRVDFTLEE